MKKSILRVGALLVAVLLLLVGCANGTPNEGWQLLEVDGKHYISFEKNEKTKLPQPNSGGIAYNGLVFYSLDELQRAFFHDQLTEKDISLIKGVFTLNENGFEICDIETMYEPVTPFNDNYDNIILQGKQYAFDYHNDSFSASVTICDDETLDVWMDLFRNDQFHVGDGLTRSIDHNGHEAVLVDKTTHTTRDISLFYNLMDGNACVYVVERYRSDLTYEQDLPELQFPYSISFYRDSPDGADYYAGVAANGTVDNDLPFTPSDEWYRSFSLSPHPYNPDADVTSQ